eukprot:Awhi_evm1s7360
MFRSVAIASVAVVASASPELCNICTAVSVKSLTGLQTQLKTLPEEKITKFIAEKEETICSPLTWMMSVSEEVCESHIQEIIGDVKDFESKEAAEIESMASNFCSKINLCKDETPEVMFFQQLVKADTPSHCAVCQSIFHNVAEKSLVVEDTTENILEAFDTICTNIGLENLSYRCHAAVKFLENKVQSARVSQSQFPEILCNQMRICENREVQPAVDPCESCKSLMHSSVDTAVAKAEKAELVCKLLPSFVYDDCMTKATTTFEDFKAKVENVPDEVCSNLRLC